MSFEVGVTLYEHRVRQGWGDFLWEPKREIHAMGDDLWVMRDVRGHNIYREQERSSIFRLFQVPQGG
jgi:hypothetical protein